MNGTVLIRSGLTLALGFVAAAAQAGRDVPPPRQIRQVQPVLAFAPPPLAYAPSAVAWRDTPPVMQGWSQDRHIPVVGLSRINGCEARAMVGMAAADDGWFDDDADYAAADFGDDGFASWGDM